jgi:hypothetical protein
MNELSMKGLHQQLQSSAELIAAFQADEQDRLNARKTEAIDRAIRQHRVSNATALKKLLYLEFGQHLSQVGEYWLVERGSQVTPLNEAITAYLSSEEGRAFTTAIGTDAPASQPAPTTGGGISAGDALMAAFG